MQMLQGQCPPQEEMKAIMVSINESNNGCKDVFGMLHSS